ncbi:hypothetical protein, partial [Empedobacter sp. UBA5036]|uniref:hypothetical protein n=1 Tax=Empedobacter sp. UBA5036 TaxID=1946438 RepID=UPI0025BA8C88
TKIKTKIIILKDYEVMQYDIGRLRMTSIKLFLNKKPNCQAEFSSASYYRQSEWRLQNVVSKT